MSGSRNPSSIFTARCETPTSRDAPRRSENSAAFILAKQRAGGLRPSALCFSADVTRERRQKILPQARASGNSRIRSSLENGLGNKLALYRCRSSSRSVLNRLNTRVVRPDIAHQLKAVAARHLNIGNDQIRLEQQIIKIAVVTVDGDLHLVALLLQDLLQNLGKRRIVVHNKRFVHSSLPIGTNNASAMPGEHRLEKPGV